MIQRTTTVGTLKNYRYSLNRSNYNMTSAMNTVISQRLFNSYAEDPAIATRCFQLRRSFQRTASQLTINDSLVHKYDVAWSAIDDVSHDLYAIADDTAFGSLIRGESDGTASGRNALGQSMVAKAKNIVQTMNGRYGDNYVFSGSDTLNVPFTWGPKVNSNYVPTTVDEEGNPKNPDPAKTADAPAFKYIIAEGKDNSDVKYTNDETLAIKVPKLNPMYDPNKDLTDLPATSDPNFDAELYKKRFSCKYLNDDDNPVEDETAAAKVPEKNPAYNENWKYKYLTADGKGTDDPSKAAEGLYYRGVPVDSTRPEDLEKLDSFTSEDKKYLDIGLGHKENESSEAVSSSVFNSALQGVYYLGGYGRESKTVELDGEKYTFNDIPTNIVTAVMEMGEILQRCDPDSGKFASLEDRARCQALAEKFEDAKNLYIERYTELDTQTGYLRDNAELLTSTADSISQQFMALEDANPAAAISEYMYARYCYDAALKVGNSVLSQSLMDYMNL